MWLLVLDLIIILMLSLIALQFDFVLCSLYHEVAFSVARHLCFNPLTTYSGVIHRLQWDCVGISGLRITVMVDDTRLAASTTQQMSP